MTAGRIERLRAALEQALAPTRLEIRNDSAAHAGHAGARDGGHLHVLNAAARFTGLGPVARHRLVYDAVGALLRGDVHALSIDARLP